MKTPPRPPRPKSALRVMATFLPHLWPKGRLDLRVRVVAALTCMVLAKAFNVSVPFFYKSAVDQLGARASGAEALLIVPLGMILAYGVARVAAQGFGELRDSIFARVTQHAIRTLALSTFDHLHRMSLRFHLDRRTGGLSRVIERGTKGIQFVLQFSLFNIGPTTIEIILVSGIFFHLFGWLFTAATLTTIIAYIVFTLVFTQWRTRFRREMNDRDTEANTKAVDSLLNYETVKYFGNEEHEGRRFDSSLRRYEEAAVRATQTLSMLNVGQGMIIACGLIAVMWLAANGVSEGTLTVGDFVMVNTFLIQLYIPLNLLGMAFREIQQGLVDMESMFDLLRIEEEVRDRPGAPALRPGPGEIRFDSVSFAYDERRPILHDISFTVQPGSMVAIVGSSGAGKSTISRILFRFYDVSAGRVLIDGQDATEVTQKSVRAAIGIVPQDTVLFNDSIRYNIRYGRTDATDAEVEEAARLASIDDFIRGLPDGYNTNVGERGLKLSGGEKQRVAIARALLKKPRIMLFDEATSALDSRTEQDIQKSLREVSANFTTLVIAHRLSTVVDADEILVLDQGRIAERGRHADLLAQGGLYRDMWDRQVATAEMEARLAEVRAGEAARGPALG